MIKLCKILVGKPEVKTSLGRFRHSGEDNIKMDFKEIDCESVGCIQFTKDMIQWWALMTMITNIWVT